MLHKRRAQRATYGILSLICFSLVLMSCSKTADKANQGAGPKAVAKTGNSGDETINPNPIETGIPNPTGTNPIMAKSVRAFGYSNVYTTTVQANKILRVKFVPGSEQEQLDGGILRPLYSKLAVYIHVDQTGSDCVIQPDGRFGPKCKATGILSNGVITPTDSRTFDFSGVFDNAACASDPSPDCRKEVTITVIKPNYDYLCLNRAAEGLAIGIDYCANGGMARVFYDSSWGPRPPNTPNHPWRGTLYIQTDDTVGLE